MRIAAVFAICLGMLVSSMISAETAKRSQDQAFTNSQTFINQHPDLRYRHRGLKAYKKARYGEALFNFKLAAKYADKPSQGMIAEMLWKGEGVAVDRAQAYAWIDLAAERNYPSMVISREKMWSMLNETERKQAVVSGKNIYELYSDAVAKPRMDAVLVQTKRNSVPGSRLGFVTTVDITNNDPIALAHDNGIPGYEGEFFYQDKLWEPSEYWKWQDAAWSRPLAGNVEIGPIETNPETRKK